STGKIPTSQLRTGIRMTIPVPQPLNKEGIAMLVRRIVTGHSPEGKAIVASDEAVPSTFVIGESGSAATVLWGREDLAQFPDDGRQPTMSSPFPPPGGCALAILEMAPHGNEFHEFV